MSKHRQHFSVPLTRNQRTAFDAGVLVAKQLGLSSLDLGPEGSITPQAVLARVRALALLSDDPQIVAAAETIKPDGALNDRARRHLLKVFVDAEGVAAFEAGLREGAETEAVA